MPEAVANAGLGLFNLALAALVLSVRPRRSANAIVAVVFALNGVFGLRWAFTYALFDSYPLVLQDFDVLITAPTWAAFFALPFVFPRRRLGPRGERVLFGACAVWVGAVWAATLAWGFPTVNNHPGNPVLVVLGFVPHYLTLGLGALLLLDTYLGSPGAVVRDQARFILAAYLMKLGSILYAVVNFLLTTDPAAVPAHIAPYGVWVFYAAVVLGPIAAATLALGASRLGPALRRAPAPPRTLGEDAFVLAAAGAGVFLSAYFGLEEYMLVRPVLLAYGMLRYQLLEVDLRERAPLVVGTILVGAAASFLDIVLRLRFHGIEPAFAVGLSLVATSVALGLLAWPVLRTVAAPGLVAQDPRGRELYRAALEEAMAAGSGHEASEDRVLRSLRSRLQISEREHAVMEASVRAALAPAGEAGVQPGQPFLGRYRIERPLGEGGFGRTYLARDLQVERAVVLKVARVAGEGEARRLLREARLVARLGHPNVVTIFDVEQVGGEVVVVMEHVGGGSLAERLASGPLPPKDALGLFDGILAALEAAHAEGILHRDVKPGNVLLTADGRAKLADFGVARAPPGSGTVTGLSADGQPGSVRYMSPEQVRGRDLDARSDLYGAAAVAYEMLAGKHYLRLDGRAEFETRLAVLEDPPELPIPGVPRPVNQLLAEALAKEPSKRPASAAEMRRRLASRTARPRGPA